MKDITSSNRVVRNALTAKAGVAKNAAASVLVSFNTITAKGLEKV